MGALINPNPIFASKVATIKDALDLPAFNAMHQASLQGSSQYANDPVLGTAFIKNVIHDFIRVGGKNIDINFFMSMFGSTPRGIDTKEIYNRYVTDMDHNVYFESNEVAAAPNGDFTVTLLRENHSANGKQSYPAKYYSLLDKENNVWYSIEDVNTTVDYGHTLTLRPYDKTVTGSVKKNKKYLVVPARLVGDYSCPADTNALQNIGFAQKVNPFRVRRDWKVKIGLMRGYKDKLRFVIMWDNEGKKIDSWDTYEAQIARENLQLAKNLLAFLGTPITNQSIINGTGATVVDDIHTGFYGYLPTVKYGGGKVLDFDPSVGIDFDGDLEPFILAQDALKQTSRFLLNHGKSFKARMIANANKMVKNTGLGLDQWMAYQRSGEKITKLEVSSYEFLGYVWDFKEMGALNDSRLLGSQYFDNLAFGLPLDGITDGNTGAAIDPIEFFQYGAQETGDYFETQNDQRDITRCEAIEGYCAESVMMATHAPGQHILFNPVKGC